MNTKAYRKLDKLTYTFRKKVELFLSECKKQKLDIFITESWRSEARQKMLRKTGTSRVRHSNHQDGKAIDIAFHPRTYGVLYPSDHKLWQKVWTIANKYWIDWGYDLWAKKYGFIDKPHFQNNKTPLSEIEKKSAGFYEAFFYKNHKKAKGINDLQGAVEKIFDNKGNFKNWGAKELFFLLQIQTNRNISQDIL